MVQGFWGKKIGMTQVFSGKKVIPVTAIDLSDWFVTSIKNKARDGYSAIQVGCLRDRYRQQAFSLDWLKDAKKYFSVLREIRIDEEDEASIQPGQTISTDQILAQGDYVDAFGITKGLGFQGVVKRHGYSGGRASHGTTFGRFPGSLSWMTSNGRVPKGKKMPGHMGVEKKVMKNLEVVKVEPSGHVLLIKGSVPGKSGSFVYLRKSR